MKIKISLLIIFIFLFFIPASHVNAQSCEEFQCNNETQSDDEYLSCIGKKKSCIETKLSEIENEKLTLKNTISVINGNINIQELKISQTIGEINKLEKEITILGDRISGLSISLDRLSTLLVDRIRTQYKQKQTNPLAIFITSKSLNKLINQYRYLSLAGKQTAQAMQRAQTQRVFYDEQKDIKTAKQEEIERKRYQLQLEQNKLVGQRKEQEQFLKLTNNDEVKFQKMLDSVKSEFEAIQAIISKRGSDTKVGYVNKGDKIATIIQGPSCNSGGSHVHFTITQSDGATVNPFNYLKKVDYQNCSGPGSCSPGDDFNPTGDWDWPISPTVRLNQGYGSTWATRNTWVGQIYSFHNGLDIASPSKEVRAVQSGTLYRGSYTGTAGCRLKYVRIDHDKNNLTSYYLHVNYY